jgi:hypothetical protein
VLGLEGGNAAVLMIGYGIKRRHIHTRNLSQAVEQFRAVQLGGITEHSQYARHDWLCFANHDGIEEGRHGFGVCGNGWAAGDHDGMHFIAVLTEWRQSSGLQGSDGVGIVDFETQGEGNRGEFPELTLRLDGDDAFLLGLAR